jgi:hypothetical protein
LKFYHIQITHLKALAKWQTRLSNQLNSIWTDAAWLVHTGVENESLLGVLRTILICSFSQLGVQIITKDDDYEALAYENANLADLDKTLPDYGLGLSITPRSLVE